MDSEIVEIAPELAQKATPLDAAFFEQHEGSKFGRDPAQEEEWIRTTSGRAGMVILTAEDENESIGLLKFSSGGEPEVRRVQSYRPCLFGPASSDAEDFESDVETDTDDDDYDSEEGLYALEEEEDHHESVAELPDNLASSGFRRNRGASWLKMDTLGQLFEKEKSENEPPKRMTMDPFGNFIIAGGSGNQAGYFEHIKMKQKRVPNTKDVKRGPTVATSPRPSRMNKLKNRLTNIFGK